MHNCLLGCQGLPDSLDHYYHCPHLHALTSFLIPETDSDPLVRFGLVHPNKNQFKVIACMFSAYHAVKSMVRTAQFTSGANNIDTSCGSEIRKHWSLFAQTFQAEACDMSVATRAFSSPNSSTFWYMMVFFALTIQLWEVRLLCSRFMIITCKTI